MGVPSVDRNSKVLAWPRSWKRAAADEDSDSPEERRGSTTSGVARAR